MSLGERFRAAREQRGLTLSEVAEHLRIRSVYLAAIEEEHWSTIGAPVYTRGFLRTYARYLSLDPEEAVAEYNAAAGTAAPQAAEVTGGYGRPYKGEAPRSIAPLLWLAGVVAIGLIAFVIYLYVTPPGSRAPLAAATGPPASAALNTPAGQTPAGPPTASPSPAPHTLEVALTAASWLRISVDGNVSIEGTFPAGTHKTFHGNSAVVRVGNAGGVDVTVDGRPIGKLGAAGDVVEKTFQL